MGNFYKGENIFGGGRVPVAVLERMEIWHLLSSVELIEYK